MRLSECWKPGVGGCRAPIIWTKSDKGKNFPVDADPVDVVGRTKGAHRLWETDQNGTRIEAEEAAQIRAAGGRTGVRSTYVKWEDFESAEEYHEAHWATCPEREAFRR